MTDIEIFSRICTNKSRDLKLVKQTKIRRKENPKKNKFNFVQIF